MIHALVSTDSKEYFFIADCDKYFYFSEYY